MNLKPRLDERLVSENRVESLRLAQALILEGKVRVDGKVVTKPGTRPKLQAVLEVSSPDQPVGRGFFKIQEGVQKLGLDIAQKTCLDAGSSTGGFTEFLLSQKAQKVYAVDVGYGQLAWKIRQNERVEVHERTNIRFAEPSLFSPLPQVLVADLSFISLLKVLPNLARVLIPGAPGIVLVKPQFEAGNARVEKGGLVRKPEVHRQILREIVEGCTRLGWVPTGLCPSPIRGAKGNLEFLLKLYAPGGDSARTPLKEAELVRAVSLGHSSK